MHIEKSVALKIQLQQEKLATSIQYCNDEAKEGKQLVVYFCHFSH
jgi:hypothetical protein